MPMTSETNESDSTHAHRMTRRQLLHTSTGAVAIVLLAACSAPAPAASVSSTAAPTPGAAAASTAVAKPAAAQAAPTGQAAATDEIKIGVLSAFTGVFSSFGIMQRAGYQLALDQASGTAGGRKIRLIEEDDQLDNEMAVAKAKKLVQQDNIDVMTGLVSGDEGLSVGDYMKDKGIPVVVMYSASEDMTMRQKSSNIVRPSWTGSQPMDVFGFWLAKVKRFKKVYMIGEDYSYPYNQAGGFKRGFFRGGGDEVKSVWHPVPTDDYSSLIASIPTNENYDAVMYNGAGADAVAFTKQYVDLGMLPKIKLLGQSNTFERPDLDSEPPELAGVLSSHLVADNLSTPEWTKFKDAYVKKQSKPPSAAAEFAYTSMRMILRAIDKTNGNVSNHTALLTAMRQVDLSDAPRGPVKLDEYNAAVQNVYIREVQPLADGIGNKGLFTVKGVNQFGPYDAQTYLKQKPDGKNYPPDKRSDMAAEMLTAASEYQFVAFA